VGPSRSSRIGHAKIATIRASLDLTGFDHFRNAILLLGVFLAWPPGLRIMR
jgi:hypothetical protein